MTPASAGDGRALATAIAAGLRGLVLATGLLLVASFPASALACPLQPADGRRIDSGDLSLAWRADPSPLPVGQHFRLLLVTCTAAGAPFDGPVAVDAIMPAHQHGMNYRPSVSALGGGRFVVEGMLFHMPGQWQIEFRMGDNPVRARLVTDVAVD